MPVFCERVDLNWHQVFISFGVWTMSIEASFLLAATKYFTTVLSTILVAPIDHILCSRVRFRLDSKIWAIFL